jgi:hypothetical protein
MERNSEERAQEQGVKSSAVLATERLERIPNIDGQLVEDVATYFEARPPINPDFSPDIVRDILLLPTANQPAALTAFKQDLFAQQEALAAYAVILDSSLTRNPDLKPRVFRAVLDEFTKRYAFTEEQVNTIATIFKDYVNTRHKALLAMRLYENSLDLVELLTKVRLPEGACRVEHSRLAVVITANARTAQQLYSNVTDIAADAVFPEFGFTGEGPLGIQYIVINQDVSEDPAVHSKTIAHEEQHILNTLIARATDEVSLPNIEETITPLHIAQPEYLASLLEEYRAEAYSAVKDELFAIYATEVTAVDANTFLRYGAYDYLEIARNHIESLTSDRELLQRMNERLLVVEYNETVRASVVAIAGLLAAGITERAAIALLSAEPFEQWPHVCERILAAQALVGGI